MPIYVSKCAGCSTEREDYLSLNAPSPECCGAPMQRIPQPAGMAFVTRNGNLYNLSMPGKQWVGGGKPKPKVISRGHGLGGRRAPPTLKKAIESKFAAEAAREKAAKEK